MELAEPKRVSLHEKNSRILTMFPSWASGLLRRRRYVEKIYEYIAGFEEDLDELKLDIERFDEEGRLFEKADVVLDLNKSILLTYAFGDMYTKALALATGGNIRADVLGEGVDLENAAEEYFTGKQEKTSPPMFLRVYNDTVVEEVPEKETNKWLELRRMLAEVGLTLKLDTKTVEISEESPKEEERKWPQGEFVTVDPYNWFCSSEEFLDEYPPTGAEIPAEDIIKDYERNGENGLILDFLLRRQPKVSVDPLPICTQLLAVLLAAYNYESVPIRKEKVTEAWQILEALSIS